MAQPFSPSSINQAVSEQPQASPDQATNTRPESKPSPGVKGALLTALLGQVADNVSTNVYGGRNGSYEMNPLLPQNKVGNATIQGLATLGTQLALRKLAPNHPTLAKVLGYTAGGIGTLDTVNNVGNGQLFQKLGIKF